MHGLTGGSWKRSAAPATDTTKNNPGGKPRGAPMASRPTADPRHRASSRPSTRIRPPSTRQGSIAAGQAPAPAMGECRLSGACAEEPRPKSLTTRSSPDQRRRPHPSTGCGFLVRNLIMKKKTIEERTKAREELWAVMQRMREAFKDVPQEEIEREVDKAVTQVRAEMRAERAVRNNAERRNSFGRLIRLTQKPLHRGTY